MEKAAPQSGHYRLTLIEAVSVYDGRRLVRLPDGTERTVTQFIDGLTSAQGYARVHWRGGPEGIAFFPHEDEETLLCTLLWEPTEHVQPELDRWERYSLAREALHRLPQRKRRLLSYALNLLAEQVHAHADCIFDLGMNRPSDSEIRELCDLLGLYEGIGTSGR